MEREEAKSRLGLFITTYILSFTGIAVLIVNFLNQFAESYVNVIPMLLLAFVVTGIMSALFTYIRKTWIPWLAAVLLLGIFFYLFKNEIMSGFCEFVNGVIDSMANYFGRDMYFIDVPRRLARYDGTAIFLNYGIVVLGCVYAWCMSRKEYTAVTLVLSAAFFVLPVLLELYGSPFFILVHVILIVELFVIIISSGHKLKKISNRYTIRLASVMMGVVVTLIGGLAILIMPESRYERPEYFTQVRDNTTELVEQIKSGEIDLSRLNPFRNIKSKYGIINNSPASFGGGKLGQIDRLNFSGEEVMQVALPAKSQKVFLKGYIGQSYKNNSWSEPVVSDDWESDFQELADNNFLPVSAAASLIKFGGDDCLYDTRVFRGTMRILSSKDGLNNYFLPSYPAVNTLTRTHGDNLEDSDIASTDGIEYYYFDDYIISDMPSLMSGIYAGSERTYRDYVYENYTAVDTTAKEQLDEMFGGRYIDTPRDRLAIAREISEYLSEQCVYDSAPGKVPAGKDFVDYFLNESKRGYCTYFATAAVMMFRSAGIPARYVEGYAFSSTNNTVRDSYDDNVFFYKNGTSMSVAYNIVSVKDSNAHAWVEYYVDGFGWVDYEVTPGGAGIIEEEATKPEETTPEETTSREPATTTATDEKQTTTAADEKETTTPALQTTTDDDNGLGRHFTFKLSETAVKAIIYILFVCFVIAAVVLVIYIRHKKALAYFNKLYNVKDNTPKNVCIILNYNRFERILKYAGFARDKHMSYIEYAHMLEESCPYLGRDEAVRFVELYEKAVFGDIDISNEEKLVSERITENVRSRIFGDMNIVRRLFYRFILNC